MTILNIIRQQLKRFWFWLNLLMIGLFCFPFIANAVVSYMRTAQYDGAIAPLFTDSVRYWETDIARWSSAYSIDPNLMATIMQIESCGHPTVVSHAGARGLFQVMPFHFSPGEDMLDPDTNALRSANFIRECATYAGTDIGLILACYNGGPSVTQRAFDTWPAETKRYYVWGTTIYRDAVTFAQHSGNLDQWLMAGGVNLCNQAKVALGMP